MIVAVKGILEATGKGYLDLGVGGVTLRVMVPASTLDGLGSLGDEVRLHTHLLVREEQPALYGFASAADLALFQMLISVSGVGPRISLALLSSLQGQSLVGAIASGDEASLSRVSGIGKKSAARIIVELKGKLGLLYEQTTPVADGDGHGVLSALTALGYTTMEASQALASVAQGQDLPMEELLRLALQRLGQS